MGNKAEKEKAAEAAEKALESAVAKKEAAIDAVKLAEEVCRGAVIAEKDAKKTVDQMASAVAKAKGSHAVEESGLESAQKALEAYNYLKDRTSTQDDEEEEAKPEVPPSPSRLSTLASSVSGLFGLSPKPEPTEEA